jgi:excisionase family DNA binding protein
MTENSAQWDIAMLTNPDFSTVKETAQHLRLCEKHIRRLIQRGELPAYRFGAAIRIKKTDIDVYVKRSVFSRQMKDKRS